MPKIGKLITFNCKFCNKQFNMLESVYKTRKTVKYCSRSCMGLDKRKENVFTEVKCDCCNKLFKKRTDHLKENNYCSKKCSGIGRRKFSIWSEHNPDKTARKEYFRKYLENNREKINKLSAEWARNNRPYRNYLQQLRRASGSLSYKDWKSIIDASPKCNYCGSIDNLQVDHIHPVSKGGLTVKDNLQVLCRRCNQTKSNKIT